jgi:hypothetical protein
MVTDPRSQFEASAIISLAGPAAVRWALREKSGGWRWAPASDDQVRAIHEAGHVAAALAFGHFVFGASIVLHPEVKIGPGFQGGLVRHGIRPESEYKPSGEPLISDRQSAARVAWLLADSPLSWKSVLRCVRTLQARARVLVQENWETIQVVAGELERHKELDQDRIESILGIAAHSSRG